MVLSAPPYPQPQEARPSHTAKDVLENHGDPQENRAITFLFVTRKHPLASSAAGGRFDVVPAASSALGASSSFGDLPQQAEQLGTEDPPADIDRSCTGDTKDLH